MAAFFAILAWRSLRSAIRVAREQRTNAIVGTSERPDRKKSVEANVAVAVVAFCLLAAVLVALYKAWPN